MALLRCLLLFYLPLASSATSINAITQSQPLLDDGRTTLVSKDEKFELGFFSPEKASSPIVQLLDSGNLVLRDERDQNPQNCLWQSFDYPCDTLLPGMKLGWDLRTGLNRRLTAWNNWDDPSPGDFRSELMLHNLPEKVFWQGSTEYFRMGAWNGVSFSDSFSVNRNITLVSNEDEVYFMYTLNNKTEIFIDVLNQTKYAMQSSLERSFLWIAGFKLGIVIQLANQVLDDLSEEQRKRESVEASPLVEAVSNHGRSCLSESYRTEECGEVPETLKIALKNLVVNADTLRMNTALKMVKILKPNQAVFA
ncbi:hypothetical protein K1719_038865 [Acacia pycnantha]|nr:hypothetical protein K1719_038865 [Acacia pycnantha]